MKTVKFKDLNVGDIFTFNNTEYKKVTEQKISCCKRLNACLVSDETRFVQIKPIEDVTVNDQQQ